MGMGKDPQGVLQKLFTNCKTCLANLVSNMSLRVSQIRVNEEVLHVAYWHTKQMLLRWNPGMCKSVKIPSNIRHPVGDHVLALE